MYTPLVEGRRPYIIDALDGLQMGAWQWAFENKVPRSAKRSIFGVLPLGCPPKQLAQSFMSSMAMSNTLGLSEPSRAHKGKESANKRRMGYNFIR